MTNNASHFTPSFDKDAVQAVVVRAALGNDPAALERLPAVLGTLDEPYRTVAAEHLQLRSLGGFVDTNVLAAALEDRQLYRVNAQGRRESLQAGQVLALLDGPPLEPGQATAYLDLLQRLQRQKREAEERTSVDHVVQTYGGDLARLADEFNRLARERRDAGKPLLEQYPSELLELIPYAQDLEWRQQGHAFLGINSGFAHVNHICNGLDVGLFIVAAPPGEGKTTLVWQMCCQAAKEDRVPVVFISYEQSKRELRAKALARLSGLPYRHILRGRLEAGDAASKSELFKGLSCYAQIAPYLRIVEADQTTTVEVIGRLASAAMAQFQSDRCLVAVDYLQVVPLAKTDVGLVTSPKDRVDAQVSALRRLARDLGVSVLCISSENRAGYDSNRLDVFKESGGIEYGADIAAILRRDKRSPGGDDAKYRMEELSIVKNRNGERGVVRFKFYPRTAKFAEVDRRALGSDS
jgi:replicative DNA helicase